MSKSLTQKINGQTNTLPEALEHIDEKTTTPKSKGKQNNEVVESTLSAKTNITKT